MKTATKGILSLALSGAKCRCVVTIGLGVRCLTELVLLAQVSPATLPNLTISTGGEVRAMAAQDDGKLIIGGQFASVNGVLRNNIARINPNGSVDATWNPGADHYVNVLVVSENHVYVGGQFTVIGGRQQCLLARLSLTDNGVADVTWNPPFSEFGGVSALAVAGTSVYVGGDNFVLGDDQIVRALAKFSTTDWGEADPNWAPQVQLQQDPGYVSALAVSGSAVFVGGSFTRIGGLSRSNLAKLSATGTGSVDPAWAPNPDVTVHSLVVAGADLYAGGAFSVISGQVHPGLARLGTEGTGAADPGWTPSVIYPLSLALFGGDLYAAGMFSTLNGEPRNNIARIGTTGTGATDGAWDPDANGAVTVLLPTETSVFAGGAFTTLAGAVSLGMAKLDRVTGRKDAAYPVQVESPGNVCAVERQSDGKIILGGNFYYVDGLERHNLARVNSDGTLDPAWNPNSNGTVSDVALHGGDLFMAGYFTKIGGMSRTGLAKLSVSTGAVDPDWNPNPVMARYGAPGLLNDIEILGTDLYVGGRFDFIGGQPRNNIARLNTAGTGLADPLWDPNADGEVACLTMGDTSAFVGGHFTHVGSYPRNHVAKLSVTGKGATDPVWNPDAENAVNAMVLSGASLYVGGFFFNIDHHPIRYLAKLSTQDRGLADPTWNPNPNSRVTTLTVNGKDLYVGGDFSRLGSYQRNCLARVSTEGTGDADPGWNPDVTWDLSRPASGTSCTVIRLLMNGNDLYVAGAFTGIGGVIRSAFAFLPVADAPIMVPDTGKLQFVRNAEDGLEVTHFQITEFNGVQLFHADGKTEVGPGDFITVEEGDAGLPYTGTGTLAAVSALNATLAGIGRAATHIDLSIPQPPVFRFDRLSYAVNEGAGAAVVTVRRLGTGSAGVNYATQDLTAQKGWDYREMSGWLDFADKKVVQPLRIPVVDDFLHRGNRTFGVSLKATTGGAVIASPRVAVVTIVENDLIGSSASSTNPIPPQPGPSASGVLRVVLEPSEANGQWRLPGESFWHDSGAEVGGLSTGFYTLVLRPVLGFRSLGNVTVAVVAGVTNYVGPFVYTALGTVTRGQMTVHLKPDAVVTNSLEPLHGQWRLAGGSWHDSGEVVTAGVGKHLVEFKEVAAWLSPPTRFIEVTDPGTSSITAAYMPAVDSEVMQPRPLDITEATGTAPYYYNGQIETSLGCASGVVVKERVVLTATHVLFDEASMCYVKGARWFFQKHAGQCEPVPQTPRAWYVLEGYASQRRLDNSPGISTPDSQNLDVAALFFVEGPDGPNLPGRGGYGGYLVSDQADNEWLMSDRPKILAGYPLKPGDRASWGKMHGLGPSNLHLTHRYQRIFSTRDASSYPGNSGGPVYVQFDDGKFYPAGIYLGGASETLVRAIDSDVVDLINWAEIAGHGGGNYVDDGPDPIVPGITEPLLKIGRLQVNLAPAAAVIAEARWRVENIDADYSRTNAAEAPLTGDSEYWVQFKPVAGFTTPSRQKVYVAADQLKTIQVSYEPVPRPVLSMDSPGIITIAGSPGWKCGLEFTESLSPIIHWIPLSTNVLSGDQVRIEDPGAAQKRTRFYRVVLLR